MRAGHAVVGAAALLAGCSLLLDPSRAPPLECPESTAACPFVSGAVSRCEQDACVYECEPGSVDADEDLAAAGSNGCEASCAALSVPLAAPTALFATVGAASGAVDFTWPDPPRPTGGVRPGAWELCWGAGGGEPEICVDVDRADACDGGSCATAITGLPDGERLVARLRGSDTCGRETELATAPTVVTAPVNAEWRAETSAWSLDSFCGAPPDIEYADGVLTLLQSGFLCVSGMLGGDDLWDDYTVDVQALIEAQPDPNVGVSVVARAHSTSGHRLAMVVRAGSGGTDDTLWLYRRLPGDGDRAVATAVPDLPLDQWFWMRLTVLDRTISMSVGPRLEELSEVARYTETSISALTRAGGFGVGIVGSGRGRFRGLRVTTPAVLPASSPTEVHTFAAGLPSTARVQPPGAAARIVPVACPALPAAAGCTSCLPDPTSGCVEIDSDGLFFNPSTLLVPLPPGIDNSAPYHVRAKFAAADEPVDHPAILAGFQGALIATATADWTLQIAGQDAGGVLTPAEWHRFELRVDPLAQTIEATWDDQPVVLANPTFPPAGGSTHLGSLRLGAATAIHGWWTELEVGP